MNLLGQGINRIFDLLVWPLAAVPAAAMIFLSVLTAAVALLIFKMATCSRSMRAARDRLMGHIYEMGLYQDHLSVLVRIQMSLARANLRYLALTLPALLALLVPMTITFVQLESRFAHRPLQAGEATVFSVTVSPDQADRTADLHLELPTGVAVEAGPVRNQPTGTVTWRLRVDDPQAGPLRLQLDGKDVAVRSLANGGSLPRLSEVSSPSWMAPLLSPGTEPLPRGGMLTEMTLHLPHREISYLGLGMNWLLAFCVFSMLGGLALKDVLKVTL